MTETTMSAAAGTEHSDTTERSLVRFWLGGRPCALPAEAVQEIVALPRLDCPPGTPSVLAGFLNLGGAAVPVLRAHRLLDLPEPVLDLDTPILLVRSPGGLVGVLVDRVAGVDAVEAKALRGVTPGSTFNDCVEGEVERDGESWHLIRPDRLLLKRERVALEEQRAAAQRRLAGWSGGAP